LNIYHDDFLPRNGDMILSKMAADHQFEQQF